MSARLFLDNQTNKKHKLITTNTNNERT